MPPLETGVDSNTQKWQEGSSRASVNSVPAMTLKGQGRTLLGLPRWQEERLGDAWLEQAWGGNPPLSVRFPDPKPEPGH